MKRNILYCLALIATTLLACKKTDSPGASLPPILVTTRYANMYVDGNGLKDSSGHLFVMRGNNFPVFWFPTLYKPSLAAAASLGCNTARIVWQLQQEVWTPSLNVLDEALAESVRQKMIPIVELHDFTGGISAGNIAGAAGWFARNEVKSVLNKYAHVLIINIANEWGNNEVTDLAWKAAYLPAITTIRNAGYKVPIMIDAPGYGQRETAIVNYGKELLASDPLKNCIFSAHAYSNWNSSGTYTARLDAMRDQGLCVIIGEFGWDIPAAQQPAGFNCHVNAPLLMQACQSKGIGYLGWSWTGNNADNACFDMCASWSDTSKLTTWGRQWAYDINGVRNTAVRASIFN